MVIVTNTMGKVLKHWVITYLRDNLKYESIKYGSDEAARSPMGMAVTDGETGREDIKLEHVTCYNITSLLNMFCKASS